MTDWLGDYRDDGVRDWAAPTERDVAAQAAQYEQRIAHLLQTIADLRRELAVACSEPTEPRRQAAGPAPRQYDKEEIR